MAKDPAFLFYDGDAARDVSHMNRLERGCYFDLIQAQRKFGSYTVEQARKIIGKDFETCWEALSLVLEQENGAFFIPWVRESILKRKEFSEIQKKRINDYWEKKRNPMFNRGISTDIPLEDENANAIENVNKNRKRKLVFKKPTLQEVIDYCQEIKSTISPTLFFNNYESTGWIKANGQPVINWKATVRTWNERDNKSAETLTDTQKGNIARFKQFEKNQEAKKNAAIDV